MPFGRSRVQRLYLKMTHCHTQREVVPIALKKEQQMNLFSNLSHTIWHCQYHIVLWDRRAKCTDWSYTPDCRGLSQDIYLRFYRYRQKQSSYSSNVQFYPFKI